MNKAVKTRIINSIELLPFGHDLYLQLARKRLGISYRGVFSSYQQAHASAQTQLSPEYDVINKTKGKNLENELPVLDKRVLDIDYPLLFWLSQIMQPSDRILELGGSIGQGFYSFEKYFPYPDNIRWVIAELPAAVDAGFQISKQRSETRLEFVDSKQINTTDKADIFITAGTLQYMEPSAASIITTLKGLPAHVLIHNLPVHKTEKFWTLQYLEVCEVPYFINSLEGIVGEMETAGYQLIDTWKNPRNVEIPYHLDKCIKGYFGFYFRKLRSNEPPAA